MKKVVIAILLFVVLFPIIAGDGINLQKIHPLESDLYEALVNLYISAGYALPSTTAPYSTDELALMLSRLERDSLSQQGKYLYDQLSEELSVKPKVFRLGAEVNLEGYLHTNKEYFTTPDDWIYSYNERQPLLSFTLEASPKRNFYLYTAIPFAPVRYGTADNINGYRTTLYGENYFTTTLFFLHPFVNGDNGISYIDVGVPFRAFGAVGGDGWNILVGREKLSWGAGKSGNLMVGDHLHYHNVGRLTTYTKNFKYTLLASFFSHPSEYYKGGGDRYPYGGYFNHLVGQTAKSSGLNMFLAHRLEWRLFKGKVNLALSESIMYQSEEGTLDLRILSPTTIFHNYYIRSNANSMIAIELDITLLKGLNIYGQVVIDEFQAPGFEPTAGVKGALPNGFGYLAGIQGNYPVLRGFLFGSLEWVMTDPYLYLRDDGPIKEGLYQQLPGEYGINYVVALRHYIPDGVTYHEDFLGYKHGGDAIVINGQLGYREYNKWHTTLNLFYMLHGTKDKWTLWAAEDLTNGTTLEKTPTTSHTSTENNYDKDAHLRDSVEKTFVAGINGGYTILKGLDVFAQADFIYIVNPNNRSVNNDRYDFQLTLGVGYRL